VDYGSYIIVEAMRANNLLMDGQLLNIGTVTIETTTDKK